MSKKVDFSKIDYERKKTLLKATMKLANKLDIDQGKESSFEDFIYERIHNTSLENVENTFEAYVYMWKLIGRDTSNSEDVYFDCIVKPYKALMSAEEILSNNDRIIESAQDPNFEQELYTNSIMDLGEQEELKENKNIKTNPKTNCLELKTSKCIKCSKDFNSVNTATCDNCKNKEENINDILYAFGFILILGWIGIGGVLRYILNPEIPTWLILSILFIGFILTRRYYRYK